ncbi:hypothetical protein SAMN05216436_10813 [bacterium A37T11]|nr:hypothetical protein SAMN05216436_10813 [bacterium A37T11]
MVKKYNFGKLVFSLEGKDKVLIHLQEELTSIESTSGKEQKIRFIFGDVPKDLDNGVFASPVISDGKSFLYEGQGFKYQVIKEENGNFKILIKSDTLRKKYRYLPKYSRFKDWNFLLPSEQLAKNFMYDVFDYITQIKNVEVGQSYMHASSFQKEDKTIAIVAWGGIGKTTAMLKLVGEQGWKFLSDDLGLIDTEGNLYRSPKKMQIYAYNLEGQPRLKELLTKGRGLLDRINWNYRKKYKGIKKVRRRVSAETLFGDDLVSKTAPLTHVFFIERVNNSEFSQRQLSVEELSQRAANTVMSEIDPYHKIIVALCTAQNDSILPEYSSLYQSTKSILSKAFSNINPILIRIPLHAGPNELVGYLNKIIE